MLLCNGKLVEIETSSKAAKFVKEKFKELDTLGWPIRFKFPDTMQTRLVIVDRGGGESFGWKYPEGSGIEATATVRTPEGAQRWTYFETEKFISDTKTKYLPKRINVTPSSIVFEKNDIEKLFFLVYISGRCEKIEGLTDQADTRKLLMVLDDKAREARKVSIDRVKQAKIMSILFGENHVDDNTIRTLAKGYNRDGVDMIQEVEILRNWLFDVVTKSSDNKAVDKFLEACELPEDIKIRASVQEAKDLKLMHVATIGKQQFWKFLQDDGTDGEMIVPINPSEKPMKAITDYARLNPDFVKIIDGMIASKKK